MILGQVELAGYTVVVLADTMVKAQRLLVKEARTKLGDDRFKYGTAKEWVDESANNTPIEMGEVVWT